jgi:hypothetical protein
MKVCRFSSGVNDAGIPYWVSNAVNSAGVRGGSDDDGIDQVSHVIAKQLTPPRNRRTR